jgi:hypothetical protein
MDDFDHLRFLDFVGPLVIRDVIQRLMTISSGPNTDLLGRRWFLVLGNLVRSNLMPQNMRSDQF